MFFFHLHQTDLFSQGDIVLLSSDEDVIKFYPGENGLRSPEMLILSSERTITGLNAIFTIRPRMGESYNAFMKFLPMSHRVATKVQDKYDAMIFVYEATPTNPRTR